MNEQINKALMQLHRIFFNVMFEWTKHEYVDGLIDS